MRLARAKPLTQKDLQTFAHGTRMLRRKTLTQSEKALVDQAAKGKTASSARRILLRAARRKTGYFRGESALRSHPCVDAPLQRAIRLLRHQDARRCP